MLESLSICEQNKIPEIYLCYEQIADLYIKKSKDALKISATDLSQSLKNKANEFLNKSLMIAIQYFSEESPHVIRIREKIRGLYQITKLRQP